MTIYRTIPRVTTIHFIYAEMLVRIQQFICICQLNIWVICGMILWRIPFFFIFLQLHHRRKERLDKKGGAICLNYLEKWR